MAHTGMDMGMWVMWTGMVLPLLALIAVGVWAVIRFTGGGRHGRAMKILEERFARGDIDAEEFERHRRVLAGGEGQR